jgi:hypothetical protein
MYEQCRITVVGERHRVDLAVPAAAPITSYVTALARACGQGSGDALASAWSLGPVIGAPFPPEQSLSELSVLDGAELYLRNIVEGEYTDPVVYDVAERVAEIVERRLEHRWQGRARTTTVVVAGLGWLVAALAALAARHQVGYTVCAELAALSGVVLPAAAWTAAERDWPVPSWLRQVVAGSAVPLLAVAAWAAFATRPPGGLAGPHGLLTSSGVAIAALTLGALIGAIIACTAAPGPGTTATLLTGGVAAVAGVAIAWTKADSLAAVTVTAVVAFALLTVAPKLVAWIIAFSDKRARGRGQTDDGDADPVATAVSNAAVTLVAWGGCLSIVLAAALVPMAASRLAYPAAAAGCLGLGLLLRAGASRLTAEVIPLLAAGAAALLTLLLFGPAHLGWPSWVSPAGAIVIAMISIITGFRRLLRSPGLPTASRPRWLGGAGSMLGGAGGALAVAALGVFGRLVTLGHHL